VGKVGGLYCILYIKKPSKNQSRGWPDWEASNSNNNNNNHGADLLVLGSFSKFMESEVKIKENFLFKEVLV
jgi:hypothetical protein